LVQAFAQCVGVVSLPGVHSTQAPALQTGVPPPQSGSLFQLPAPVQVCGVSLSRQRFVVGWHGTQLPARQTEFVPLQSVASCQ
jgi:hypothetical protein